MNKRNVKFSTEKVFVISAKIGKNELKVSWLYGDSGLRIVLNGRKRYKYWKFLSLENDPKKVINFIKNNWEKKLKKTIEFYGRK